MHTPEEIKKGLYVCPDELCHMCPYELEGDCMSDCMSDALAYIQQLESRLAQAERERDAAVRDVMKNCESCKHSYMNNPDVSICPHVEYCSPRHDKWQWRGICDENTKEDEENAD